MKSLNFNKSNAQQEDVLSKAQMKNILGGHGGGGDGSCMLHTCSVTDVATGKIYQGHCALVETGGGNWTCECDSAYGPYNPEGGTSKCYVA